MRLGGAMTISSSSASSGSSSKTRETCPASTLTGKRPFTTALAAGLLSDGGDRDRSALAPQETGPGTQRGESILAMAEAALSERLASTTSPSLAAIMLRRGFGGSPCLRHRPPERSLGASPSDTSASQLDKALRRSISERSNYSESKAVTGLRLHRHPLPLVPPWAQIRPAPSVTPCTHCCASFEDGHLFACEATSRRDARVRAPPLRPGWVR